MLKNLGSRIEKFIFNIIAYAAQQLKMVHTANRIQQRTVAFSKDVTSNYITAFVHSPKFLATKDMFGSHIKSALGLEANLPIKPVDLLSAHLPPGMESYVFLTIKNKLKSYRYIIIDRNNSTVLVATNVADELFIEEVASKAYKAGLTSYLSLYNHLSNLAAKNGTDGKDNTSNIRGRIHRSEGENTQQS